MSGSVSSKLGAPLLSIFDDGVSKVPTPGKKDVAGVVFEKLVGLVSAILIVGDAIGGW